MSTVARSALLALPTVRWANVVEPRFEIVIAEQFSDPTLLQSTYWGAHKGRFGWSPRALAVRWFLGDRSGAFDFLVLLRRLPLNFALAYIPHGPTACLDLLEAAKCEDIGPGTLLSALARQTAAILGKKIVLLRFDPDWSSEERITLEPLRKGTGDIQPPDTVVLDLRPSEDEILSAMKSKHRYNLRLAAKKGVQVRGFQYGNDDFEEAFEAWYRMYQTTAERDRIGIHSKEYYRSAFELFPTGDRRSLELLLAEHEGDLLAGIIVARWKDRATYLYGASSNLKRNFMATYALQWEALRRARAAGAKSYDFFGIPPAKDPEHPMYGLYQFKTGFGGSELRYPGTWDFWCRPMLSSIFDLVEKVRARRVLRAKKSGERRKVLRNRTD